MRFEHTVANLQTGRPTSPIFSFQTREPCVCLSDPPSPRSLLNIPFDFSQAFDRALKNIVNTLPNRPAHETAEDTVRPL